MWVDSVLGSLGFCACLSFSDKKNSTAYFYVAADERTQFDYIVMGYSYSFIQELRMASSVDSSSESTK